MTSSTNPPKLTHLDREGRARMVDVSDKPVTRRRARARSIVQLSAQADRLLKEGGLPKGNPLEVVRLAALQAAKQTPQWIPLCHPLHLTAIDVVVTPGEDHRWEIVVEVGAEDRTGVEMEAMTGASAGALALYDMVKAVDRAASVQEVVLLEKSGGKSGEYRREGSR